MITIAHLSDLHFGRTDPRVVHSLLQDIRAIGPDLVVVSGDLTQRARDHQFTEARNFLENLPAPSLVVPGNHDLEPLFKPLARLLSPRDRFHRHLPNHPASPVWEKSGILVMGLDSTRHLRWKSGKLRSSHLDRVDQAIAHHPHAHARVVFLHHPPSTARSGHPFASLAERGIDLVLAGHVHHARSELIPAHGRSAVLVQASTACSTRLREDCNGYGVIRLSPHTIRVELRGWSGNEFHHLCHHAYERHGHHWHENQGQPPLEERQGNPRNDD